MKEKEMSLSLCVTCGFDYTYSLKIFCYHSNFVPVLVLERRDMGV